MCFQFGGAASQAQAWDVGFFFESPVFIYLFRGWSILRKIQTKLFPHVLQPLTATLPAADWTIFRFTLSTLLCQNDTGKAAGIRLECNVVFCVLRQCIQTNPPDGGDDRVHCTCPCWRSCTVDRYRRVWRRFRHLIAFVCKLEQQPIKHNKHNERKHSRVCWCCS